MKIRPVGAELFHADLPDKRTDKTKVTVGFRNFVSAKKNDENSTVYLNL